MDQIKHGVNNLKVINIEGITQETLEDYGLKGITLRRYQLDGITWVRNCYDAKHGCILGDEMGLGKTIQVISVLLHLSGSRKTQGPFLVLSPLSVLANWKTEFLKFASGIKVVSFVGNKDEREGLKYSLRNSTQSQGQDGKGSVKFDVILTTYEICLREASFLSRFHWTALVVDEAHRLKNCKSLLYQELVEFQTDFSILVTGTPVQNNLNELYSLLSFVAPSIFLLDLMEDFVESFSSVTTTSLVTSSELRQLLLPFLLRRVKSEVMLDLPEKSEVILYAGMSEVQKKYYKAILTRDLEAFSNEGPNKTRLNNILVHLRKCVNHPYLFDGVEPEPFQLGDHLITASGKLHAIDQLLSFLYSRGHKVLMFSQMTRMLDIIQDYLGYRGYFYERLDGSVRGEERYLAIKNFNETDDTFIFLLSTRAGGQGLNLMTADTVIFVDSDYNPQNDLQAAARAHRIGQTRPVKIIRLVSRNTVEQIILNRADDKLQLTNTVIEGGQFSGAGTNKVAATNLKLSDILKFGLDRLFESEESSITEKDFERILGCSCDGRWIVDELGDVDDEAMDDTELQARNMYVYDGRDYSRGTSTQDLVAFDKIAADILDEVQNSERKLRSVIRAPYSTDLPTRKTKLLTPEELEQRRIKREEAAAKRAKLQEEEDDRKAHERKRRLYKLWQDHSYTSMNIVLDGRDEDEDDLLSSEDSHCLDIQYVRGDVTHPINTPGNHAIVVHCVDDSGYWGQGGLFTVISRRSAKVQEQYELAGNMKDLHLGDAHLIALDDMQSRQDGQDSVALIVAQTRDRQHRLTAIKLSALGEGLQRVAQEAKQNKATVHLPRIGHSTPGFNWYGTERLIRKHLASKGIPTSIYYFPRNNSSASQTETTTKHESLAECSTSRAGKSSDKARQSRRDTGVKSPGTCPEKSSVHSLPDFMSGVTVYFHDVSGEAMKKLRRYVIAFNGDVENTLTRDVSHVVCGSTGQAHTLVGIRDKVQIVTTQWLEDCCRKQSLLQTQHYQL